MDVIVVEVPVTAETVQVVSSTPAVEVTPGIGPQGPPGPTGPQGPQGPAGGVDQIAYTHIQDVPAAAWTIVHGLPFTPAAVTVVDSAGTEWVGDVQFVAAGTIRVSFAAPFAGTAYLS